MFSQKKKKSGKGGLDPDVADKIQQKLKDAIGTEGIRRLRYAHVLQSRYCERKPASGDLLIHYATVQPTPGACHQLCTRSSPRAQSTRRYAAPTNKPLAMLDPLKFFARFDDDGGGELDYDEFRCCG